MRGTRTIWRAGFALLARRLASLSLFVLTANCEASRGKPKRSAPSRPEPRQLRAPDASSPEAAPTDRAAAMPSAVLQTLQVLHEQRLLVLPPSVPAQELEFGPERLLQANQDHVVLRDTQQGESLSEVNLGTVLALAHGSDGALFAIGTSGGTRFESHTKKGRAFPHAAFLPGSTLFPDLESPSQFYVHYPVAQELLRYSFESEAGAFLPIEAHIPLEGCVSAPTQLRDGALACRTATGFARKAPRGARTDFKPAVDLGQPFRLLPAKRLDELYAIDRGGEVKHVRLVAGVPVLAAFQLPAPPYAAAANAEALAFVLVSAPEVGKERRFRLLVTDLDGQIRMQAELGSPAASADDDWAKAVTSDKNLAISGFEPLVAVGGAGYVAVWDYRDGKPRFTR
jgi:hypothetical protein